MNRDLLSRLFTFSSITLVILLLPIYLASAPKINIHKENTVTGTVELGSTKKQVLKILGKPDSPQAYDFVYAKKDNEIVVCFNDKTKLAEAIIVKGKSRVYSVGGVKLGDSKDAVEKAFGDPEVVFSYKGGVECWYYPSKNVNFAFDNDKIVSFSVSNCNQQVKIAK